MAQFKITIDHTKVSADLTDFPIYIDLSDMPSSFWSTVSNGGGDIRCYKSDGVTELPREVVSCNTANSTGELHIKYTGTLSSSVATEIIVDVDGARSDYGVTDTYGRNAVWSNYKIILHLDESSGEAIDSTGVLSPTYEGAGMPNKIQGSVGSGQQFSSAGYIQYPNNTHLNLTNPTFEFWYKSSSVASGDNRFPWSRRSTTTNGNTIFIYNTTNLRWHWDINGAGSRWDTGVSQPTDNQWHHMVFTYDGSTQRLYQDGSQVASRPKSDGMGNASTVARVGANTVTLNGFIQRSMDEFRLSNEARSADWISTQYNNQNNPGTFYTIEEIATSIVAYKSSGTFEYKSTFVKIGGNFVEKPLNKV